MSRIPVENRAHSSFQVRGTLNEVCAETFGNEYFIEDNPEPFVINELIN